MRDIFSLIKADSESRRGEGIPPTPPFFKGGGGGHPFTAQSGNADVRHLCEGGNI